MRQRLLVFLLSCLGTLLPTLAHAWWQEDWSYRKQISLDTTQQGAAITDQVGRIPLLVRLHTGNFSFDGVTFDLNHCKLIRPRLKTNASLLPIGKCPDELALLHI